MSFNPCTVNRETDTVTIASGDATGLSGAIDLTGHVLAGIFMPAAWTTGNLTFQAAIDTITGTYQNVFDNNGNELTVTAAAAEYLAIPPSLFYGLRFIKVRSGTSGTPVTQGGARVLTLVGRLIA